MGLTVIKLPRNLFFLFMISAVLVVCAWMATQLIIFLIVYMNTLWLFVWLLGFILVVPAIGFYSSMMLDMLYVGVGRFLADVRNDGSVDLLNNGDLPV